MSVEEFIREMPKAELRLRLEGIFRKETLLMIAEQNEIRSSVKKFENWVALLDKPEIGRIDETVQFVAQWLQVPDDLSRLVYDLGVILAKQGVKYVEVMVNTALFMQAGMSFEEFMSVLNDGRDRAQRGWGIHMNWILSIPWEEPRRADETVRWATSAIGKRFGVVGISLAGDDNAQPVGQFARAFNNAKKKSLPTAAFAGNNLDAEGILGVIEELEPNRLMDGRGVEDAPEVIEALVAKDITLDVAVSRGIRLGWYEDYSKHPIRRLYDENVKLTVSSDMPSYYGTSITEEYQYLVDKVGLTLEELEDIALNAVRYSFMSNDDKQVMLGEFQEAYAHLREVHILSQSEATSSAVE